MPRDQPRFGPADQAIDPLEMGDEFGHEGGPARPVIRRIHKAVMTEGRIGIENDRHRHGRDLLDAPAVEHLRVVGRPEVPAAIPGNDVNRGPVFRRKLLLKVRQRKRHPRPVIHIAPVKLAQQFAAKFDPLQVDRVRSGRVALLDTLRKHQENRIVLIPRKFNLHHLTENIARPRFMRTHRLIDIEYRLDPRFAVERIEVIRERCLPGLDDD